MNGALRLNFYVGDHFNITKPNMQTKVVIVKDTPRLLLVAKKDIEPGTELLYDYGDR